MVKNQWEDKAASPAPAEAKPDDADFWTAKNTEKAGLEKNVLPPLDPNFVMPQPAPAQIEVKELPELFDENVRMIRNVKHDGKIYAIGTACPMANVVEFVRNKWAKR